MKTPDVMREFDERFTSNYIPDGSMKYVELRGSEVEALKAFIQEKLKERGEMIARLVEQQENVRDAAAIARSYEE